MPKPGGWNQVALSLCSADDLRSAAVCGVRPRLHVRRYRSRTSAGTLVTVAAFRDMQPVLRLALPGFHTSAALQQSVNRHLE